MSLYSWILVIMIAFKLVLLPPYVLCIWILYKETKALEASLEEVEKYAQD